MVQANEVKTRLSSEATPDIGLRIGTTKALRKSTGWVVEAYG